MTDIFLNQHQNKLKYPLVVLESTPRGFSTSFEMHCLRLTGRFKEFISLAKIANESSLNTVEPY